MTHGKKEASGTSHISGNLTVKLEAFGVAGLAEVSKPVLRELRGTILHSSQLLVLGGSGTFGERVLGRTPTFWRIIKYADENGVESLHSLLPKDGRLFEELIAGVYSELGYNLVELSPQRGDGGVDVWAIYELPGTGKTTIMDQVKLYDPGRSVGPGDVGRILAGENRGTRYSKAVLSTTGKIPPVVRKEVEPYGERVELRGPDELSKIFEDIRQGK